MPVRLRKAATGEVAEEAETLINKVVKVPSLSYIYHISTRACSRRDFVRVGSNSVEFGVFEIIDRVGSHFDGLVELVERFKIPFG